VRDFSTISPSARSIILMKGHTDIPYAREAAELVTLPEAFIPDFSNVDLLFWSKVLHFETRYRGIDQLIEDLDVSSFLELSSGFNLRCVEVSNRTGKVYVDTDLPDLIKEKTRLVELLKGRADLAKVRLEPLNVLDEVAFLATTNKLPLGKVAIITEGLLMYFNDEEKKRLCEIVHKVLSDRGGYWITSDIYVRGRGHAPLVKQDSEVKAFTDKHNVEDNKFSSFEEARKFFSENGFQVEREEALDVRQLSSFNYLVALLPETMRSAGHDGSKMQTSWRIKPL